MIHFDFIVEDDEASLIFQAVRDMLVKTRLNAMDVTTFDEAHRVWSMRHADYIEVLMTKMTNKRA